MAEFNAYWTNQDRRTRKFQVKPATIVNQGYASDHLSRPVKLKVLSVRRIAKLLCSDERYFYAFPTLVDCLPYSLRDDILTQLEQKCQHHHDRVFRFADSSYSAMTTIWLHLHVSDTLVLREFLGYHWSSLIFQHIASHDKIYPDIKKLTLQSNEVNQVNKQERSH